MVAVLAPLLTLSGAATWLVSLQDARDQTAARMAGKEVEGKVRPEGAVAYIRQQMTRMPQKVVVLGDSLAHADIHHEPFAKHLELPPRSIARMSIPGSGAPTWYAVLDNHVFGRGHRPEWVVVVAALPSLLQLIPSSPAHRATLHELMDDDDTLLRQRLDEGAPRWWSDLLTARVKAKQLFTRGVRGGAVGWVFGASRPPSVRQTRVDWGSELADRASARVFDRRQIDLHQSRAIVDAIDPRLEALDLSDLPPVADSWLPELLALCRAHGARLAVVKPPMAPTMPPDGWDHTPDALRRDLRALFGDDAVFMDDSRLELSPNGFRDEAHMSEGAARRYGMLVGARLARLAAGERTVADPLPVGFLDHPRLSRVPSDRSAFRSPQPMDSLARTRRFDLSFLRPAADRAIIAGAPFDARCLPFVVIADEVVVPPHADGCWGMMNDDRPGTCFDGTHLWVRTVPEDAALALRPHPTGSCDDGRRWLGAGDRLRWAGLVATEVTFTAVSPDPLDLVLTSGPPPKRKPWRGQRLENHTFALPRQSHTGGLELRNGTGAGPVLLLEAFVP